MHRFLLMMLALLGLIGTAQAHFVLIAGAGSNIPDLEKQQAANLYLGKPLMLASGVFVQPVDVVDTELRRDFYLHLTSQNLAMIDAYWAQLQFAGRSKPLLKLESEQEVIDFVRRRNNAIGFISRAALPKDKSVRVLLVLE